MLSSRNRPCLSPGLQGDQKVGVGGKGGCGPTLAPGRESTCGSRLGGLPQARMQRLLRPLSALGPTGAPLVPPPMGRALRAAPPPPGRAAQTRQAGRSPTRLWWADLLAPGFESEALAVLPDTGRLFAREQEHGLSVASWAGWPPRWVVVGLHTDPPLCPPQPGLLARTTVPAGTPHSAADALEGEGGGSPSLIADVRPSQSQAAP